MKNRNPKKTSQKIALFKNYKFCANEISENNG